MVCVNVQARRVSNPPFSRDHLFSRTNLAKYRYRKQNGNMNFKLLSDIVVRVIESSEVSEPSPELTSTLALKAAATCIPHPEKVDTGGEDAHFISTQGGGALGVADGVGGWRESGVDPADYSQTLMRLACQFLESDSSSMSHTEKEVCEAAEKVFGRTPQGAMEAGHKGTRLPGSSTILVMSLDAQNKCLKAANLGDSGFMIVRDGKIQMQSTMQQHFFDCPYQLGCFPTYVDATDTALDSNTFDIPLQVGDVIVAGTDGLWDNCFPYEITKLLNQFKHDPQTAAKEIANLASQNSLNDDYKSPYIMEALNQGIDLPWWEKLLGASFNDGAFKLKQMSGGKLDDITVLVALVEEREIEVVKPDTDLMDRSSSDEVSSSEGEGEGDDDSSESAVLSTSSV
eukprot:TRINITY_DN5185_c0_g2_i1.p1 TRINITY_DN5185_c0_g2~~TRINITY_DN5185_c0_g2_i1.p1  ORF type:complete len:428 (+),score=95.58 TRINITY_DN5185_c0_g2_i1:90-1286(+)